MIPDLNMRRRPGRLLTALLALGLTGCNQISQAQQQAPSSIQSPLDQLKEAPPYALMGSKVYDIPDPISGRAYQIFVDLPPSYGKQPSKNYPVVYVTDADYAFPVVRNITRRLNGNKPRVEEFILIGLSYAKSESAMESRRRDYTPTANAPSDAPSGQIHGQGAAYRDYVDAHVMPFVERHFRVASGRNYFVGHSYGGLLGAQILFTKPKMFSGYILGSPSFWYDDRHVMDLEREYAGAHKNLSAKVYLYIGEYEARRKGDKRFHQEFFDMVIDNQRFAETLEKRAYPDFELKSDILNDEDHLTVAPRGFTKGLLHLLPAND